MVYGTVGEHSTRFDANSGGFSRRGRSGWFAVSASTGVEAHQTSRWIGALTGGKTSLPMSRARITGDAAKIARLAVGMGLALTPMPFDKVTAWIRTCESPHMSARTTRTTLSRALRQHLETPRLPRSVSHRTDPVWDQSRNGPGDTLHRSAVRMFFVLGYRSVKFA